MTPRHPLAAVIVMRVAELYGIYPDLIWAQSNGRRSATIDEAKQLAYWAVRQQTRWSYPEVGTAFGVTHKAIMTGCKRTERRQTEGQGTPTFRDALRVLVTAREAAE